MFDRPFWPPEAEIVAQAFDNFAQCCVDHPDDCILKQAEVYIEQHRAIHYWVEAE